MCTLTSLGRVAHARASHGQRQTVLVRGCITAVALSHCRLLCESDAAMAPTAAGHVQQAQPVAEASAYKS